MTPRQVHTPTAARAVFARFLREVGGVGTVEFSLILPAALAVYGMMILAMEGMSIKRDVVFTARTITDLVTQQGTTVSTASVDCMLGAAGQAMYPWSSANLSIVLSEVQIQANGDAVVQWSRAAYNGSARAPGSTIPFSGSGSAKFTRNSHQILGEVSYDYHPLQTIVQIAPSFNLSEAIYMFPRNSASITLSTP